MGSVPNLFQRLAASPAALEGFLALKRSLDRGKLPASLRERISLTVAQINGCRYCLSAHTSRAASLGLGETEIEEARRATASAPKTDAALKFVKALVLQRGEVGNEDLRLVREAGFTEGERAELVACTALNIFANYYNHVAGTEIDFPKADLELE